MVKRMTEKTTAHGDESPRATSPVGDDAETDAVARVLASAESRARSVTLHGQRATALQADDAYLDDRDGDQFDREDRAALRRGRGLSTELDDDTEVEYRELPVVVDGAAALASDAPQLHDTVPGKVAFD